MSRSLKEFDTKILRAGTDALYVLLPKEKNKKQMIQDIFHLIISLLRNGETSDFVPSLIFNDKM